MWETITMQIPYDGDDDETINDSIKGGADEKLAVPDDLNPKFKAMLQACWSNDPKRRPTAMELMQQSNSSSLKRRGDATLFFRFHPSPPLLPLPLQ